MERIRVVVLGLVSVSLALIALAVVAEVTRVEMGTPVPLTGSQPFGTVGAYQRIDGTAHFAIDPANPRNEVIVDLGLAPRNADGLVEMTADLSVFAPVDTARGNGIVLVDIANRGRRTALSFNRWTRDNMIGDGFLMKRGYTIVWIGWEFDVAPGPDAIRIQVPVTSDAEHAPIGGLGFAAVRDVTSWIKYADDALVSATHALAFGTSQSGRFLRTFLYLGFNTDENDRKVFDGVIPHVAGSSRLDLNRRGAEPISRGLFTATSFPFADPALTDPITNAKEGQLENPRAAANQPLIFYTNTSVEYWGGGRVAALVHTSPNGMRDIDLPDNTRYYLLAGTQHVPGPFPPPADSPAQQMTNPIDYMWNMRALLVAMEEWLLDGKIPPPSVYPKHANKTLVRAAELDFPAIPSVASPSSLTAGTRVANDLIDGGGEGVLLPLLVPAVDADGNETAGILHPEISVPLATYTGWNFSEPVAGASPEPAPLIGSYVPFPTTKADRLRANDPRTSIAERYPTKEEYVLQVQQAGEALIRGRYLLAEDLQPILERAGAHWDLLVP